MKPFLIILVSLCFSPAAFGQQDSGFTNKKEAKNLLVNGKKEGKWFEYKDSGFVKTTDTNACYYLLSVYKADKKVGTARLYRKNGKLKSEGTFINGKEEGIEKQYYENGMLQKRISFKDGNQNGKEDEYDEKGVLKTEKEYLNGHISYGYYSIDIKIGCGFAGGVISIERDSVSHLVKIKNDTGLVKLIYADDITLRFLSIIAIDDISKKRKITLTEQEEKTINDFKKRKDEVYCCRGDDEQFHSTVEEIFNNPKLQIRKVIAFL